MVAACVKDSHHLKTSRPLRVPRALREHWRNVVQLNPEIQFNPDIEIVLPREVRTRWRYIGVAPIGEQGLAEFITGLEDVNQAHLAAITARVRRGEWVFVDSAPAGCLTLFFHEERWRMDPTVCLN